VAVCHVFTDPKEPPIEEFDPDYTDDLGDDLPGVTPHPFVDPVYAMQILRIASALLLCHNITDRLYGSLLLFEPLTLLQPYTCSPCC
jgi:hypothetical protein